MRLRRKLGLLVAVSAVTLVALAVRPAHTYVFNYTTVTGNPEPQMDHWDFSAFPVVWSLNPSTAGAMITGTRSVAQVLEAAFGTWSSAPNASITVSRGADTALTTVEGNDDTNLICFHCSHTDFSDTNTLALTMTFVADKQGMDDFHGGTAKFAGQMVKAAIFFNPKVAFNTDQKTSNAQDLQAVAVHEIGHFFGLNHSGVVRAIMYRAASNIHQLGYDDVAALSVLYPPTCQQVATGAISGKVARSSGTGVFGAHVFAESLSASQPFPATIRKTPIGALTRPDGTYRIEGVPPDSYVVVTEPMDGPVTNEDFGGALGKNAVETDFSTGWH